MSTSGSMTLGRGEVGSQCINEEFEFGETDIVKEKKETSVENPFKLE